LARHGTLDRPMPRVVHSRGHLIREQGAVRVKELDGQHAAVLEPVEQRVEPAFGRPLQRTILERRDGRVQYTVAMHILGERVVRALAVSPPYSDERQLAL